MQDNKIEFQTEEMTPSGFFPRRGVFASQKSWRKTNRFSAAKKIKVVVPKQTAS
jgi:hypothetical protein